MSTSEQTALQIRPIINYPREAQVGERYLMTIDIQLTSPNSAWDYEEEEYPISFILNTHPYFTYEPLHGQEPTILLHRNGGTYGPAEYVLTAAEHEIEKGKISILFVTGRGLPLAQMELECAVSKALSQEFEQQSIMITSKTKVPVLSETELIKELASSLSRPEMMEAKERINWLVDEQLSTVGWSMANEFLDSVKDYPSRWPGNVALRLLRGIGDEEHPYFFDYLLLHDRELVGIIYTHSSGESLIGIEEEVSQELLSHEFGTELADAFAKQKSGRRVVPFIYETNGTETYFTNYLEPKPRSRKVFTFHQPTTFGRWLKHASAFVSVIQNGMLRSRLQRMPAISQIEVGEQYIEALEALEKSLAKNQSRILLRSDIEKTKLFFESSHRLLRNTGAERILYLASSNSEAVIALENLRFEIFLRGGAKVKLLDSNESYPYDAGIYVSTLEYFVSAFIPKENKDQEKHLLGQIHYNFQLPIESFDFIFVIDGDENIYKVWPSVLEYFDAFIIGLESSVSSQTLNFYQQNLVYQVNHVRSFDYINGLEKMSQAAQGKSWGREFEIFHVRMRALLTKDQSYGRTTASDSDRFIIIDELNQLAERYMGTTYISLCEGGDEPENVGELVGGHYWAVLVGINTYQDTSYRNLNYCMQDVQRLYKTLLSGGYVKERIHLLTEEDQVPTRAEILSSLKAVASATKPADTLLFYFSGHGDMYDGEGYLVPTDGWQSALEYTALSMKDVTTILKGAETRKKVMVLDARHSGAAPGGRGKEPLSPDFVRRVYEQAEGMAVFSSCKEGQYSYEEPELKSGVFTHFFVEGLQATGDIAKNGCVTVLDINSYVYDKVVLWASQKKVAQKPLLQYLVQGEIRLVTYQSLHAMFLYTSEETKIMRFLDEYQKALNSRLGDYCNIHTSIAQFKNDEAIYDRIDILGGPHSIEVRSVIGLPGIFFWDLQKKFEYIPLNQQMREENIKKIVRIIFQEIMREPSIASVTRAKAMLP